MLNILLFSVMTVFVHSQEWAPVVTYAHTTIKPIETLDTIGRPTWSHTLFSPYVWASAVLVDSLPFDTVTFKKPAFNGPYQGDFDADGQTDAIGNYFQTGTLLVTHLWDTSQVTYELDPSDTTHVHVNWLSNGTVADIDGDGCDDYAHVDTTTVFHIYWGDRETPLRQGSSVCINEDSTRSRTYAIVTYGWLRGGYHILTRAWTTRSGPMRPVYKLFRCNAEDLAIHSDSLRLDLVTEFLPDTASSYLGLKIQSDSLWWISHTSINRPTFLRVTSSGIEERMPHASFPPFASDDPPLYSTILTVEAVPDGWKGETSKRESHNVRARISDSTPLLHSEIIRDGREYWMRPKVTCVFITDLETLETERIPIETFDSPSYAIHVYAIGDVDGDSHQDLLVNYAQERIGSINPPDSWNTAFYLSTDRHPTTVSIHPQSAADRPETRRVPGGWLITNVETSEHPPVARLIDVLGRTHARVACRYTGEGVFVPEPPDGIQGVTWAVVGNQLVRLQ